MKQKRKAEITVETEQIVIIHQAGQLIRSWCPGCASRVPMVTSQKAALLLGSSLRTVCRQVEAGQLHFYEAENSSLYICLNSITNYLNSN